MSEEVHYTIEADNFISIQQAKDLLEQIRDLILDNAPSCEEDEGSGLYSHDGYTTSNKINPQKPQTIKLEISWKGWRGGCKTCNEILQDHLRDFLDKPENKNINFTTHQTYLEQAPYLQGWSRQNQEETEGEQ